MESIFHLVKGGGQRLKGEGNTVSLQVLPSDVLTRVSEYVPEVVDYIQHIIARGFA